MRMILWKVLGEIYVWDENAFYKYKADNGNVMGSPMLGLVAKILIQDTE
jgi:hypothetical protein